MSERTADFSRGAPFRSAPVRLPPAVSSCPSALLSCRETEPEAGRGQGANTSVCLQTPAPRPLGTRLGSCVGAWGCDSLVTGFPFWAVLCSISGPALTRGGGCVWRGAEAHRLCVASLWDAGFRATHTPEAPLELCRGDAFLGSGQLLLDGKGPNELAHLRDLGSRLSLVRGSWKGQALPPRRWARRFS